MQLFSYISYLSIDNVLIIDIKGIYMIIYIKFILKIIYLECLLWKRKKKNRIGIFMQLGL